MFLVDLDFRTNDEPSREACLRYWLVGEDGRPSVRVAEIAPSLGVRPHGVAAVVAGMCVARVRSRTCPTCGDAPIVTSRDALQRLLSERAPFEKRCAVCVQADRAAIAQAKARADQEQRDRIHATFPLRDVRLPDLDAVPLDIALSFVSFARLAAAEDFSYLKQLRQLQDPLSPGGADDFDILRRLRGSGLIVPHPGSPLDAFEFDNRGEPSTFFLDRVFWAVPEGRLADVLDDLSDRLQETQNDPWWSEDVHGVWTQIAVLEVMEYLAVSLDDHELPFHPGEKTRKVIADALEHFSVGQLFMMVWSATEKAAAFRARGHHRDHAANTVPSRIQSYAERARVEGWNVRQGFRDRRCPQSEISRVFSTLVMAQDEVTLKQRPRQLRPAATDAEPEVDSGAGDRNDASEDGDD